MIILRYIIWGMVLTLFSIPAQADYTSARRAFNKGDYNTAFREWLAMANAGDVKSQTQIGKMYDWGVGVDQNYNEALKWFILAAEKGDAEAQFMYGWYIGNGQGIAQDNCTALKWIKSSAENGFAKAQHHLAMEFKYSDPQCGVTEDPRVAYQWDLKAAKQGFADAQAEVALTLRIPKEAQAAGISVDLSQSFNWALMAAEQNHTGAQSYIASCYAYGTGVPPNYILALKWINIATMNIDTAQLKPSNVQTGDEMDLNLRRNLERKLSPEQIAQAQEMARLWHPKQEKYEDDSTVDEVVTGTGFTISQKGRILTNYHVVQGAKSIYVVTKTGKHPVNVVAEDIDNDLALLGYFPSSAFFPFSNNPKIALGQEVLALGFPLQGLLAPTMNLTTGNISSLAGIQNDTRMVQFTAPVQAGNSGGPLLDRSGNIIGVVTQKLNALRTNEIAGDLPQNINFALRGSIVLNFLETNSVSHSPLSSTRIMSNETIGEMANTRVFMIECHR
jgi:S1-C subfamily serine protease